MTLPTFIIGGTAKAGTSTLYHHLSRHPQVFMSPTKEPYYFALGNRPPAFRGPGDHFLSPVATYDLAAYSRLFSHAAPAQERGEGSTWYLYVPAAAMHIRRVAPESKLVFVLRNPVDRAFSSYLHLVRDGREPLDDFDRALDAEPARIAARWAPIWHYTRMGLYAEQIERYYDLFPQEQIHVCIYDDMVADLPGTLSSLCRFLGVEPLRAIDTSLRANVSGVPRSWALNRLLRKNSKARALVRRVAPPATRRLVTGLQNANLRPKAALQAGTARKLADIFAGDIERLSALLERDLSHWYAAHRYQ